MSVGRNLKVGTALSLIGGALTLFYSVTAFIYSPQNFVTSLTIVGGILVLVAATFMYVDSQHRMFWGAVVLFSSTLGLLALGLTENKHAILIETFALILGVVGGALGIAQK